MRLLDLMTSEEKRSHAEKIMDIFVDGSRVTPGTEKCMCDSPVPRPDGKPRNCEFPCWQRVGMTTDPCCPDCAPLAGDEE